MPYRMRISEMDSGIAAVTDAIAALRRAKRKQPGEMEKLLAEMARLKARRTRYMLQQRLLIRQRGP